MSAPPCLVLLALALSLPSRPTVAQTACTACQQGEAVIRRFELEPVRAVGSELAALSLVEPLSPAQYTQIVELRQRRPGLVRLGVVDDPDLALVAAALCGAGEGTCATATLVALRCLADRCDVALPPPDPTRDIVTLPAACHRYVTGRRTSRLGLGGEWGAGTQRSAYPTDGAAWSVGIEARVRATQRLGIVARVDRTEGRDEALDLDGDGKDDAGAGSIARIQALAGPSIVLHAAPLSNTTRFLQLDLLGGYTATRSQPDEQGPVAGLDLSYQISVFRSGLRVVQGFGDARDATLLLAHLGLVAGAAPTHADATGCATPSNTRPRTRLALGFDIPLTGYGISSDLGYLATGLGMSGIWYLTSRVDAVLTGDVLLVPRYQRDRVVHHAVLAGLRIDHGRRRGTGTSRSGWSSYAQGGYAHGAGVRPTTVGSGPVVDLSVAYGRQGDDGAGYLRLHARFGVAPDNNDYRALFLSLGFEFRLDPRYWKNRL